MLKHSISLVFAVSHCLFIYKHRLRLYLISEFVEALPSLFCSPPTSRWCLDMCASRSFFFFLFILTFKGSKSDSTCANRICHCIFPWRTSFSQNWAEKYPLKYFLIWNERITSDGCAGAFSTTFTKIYVAHVGCSACERRAKCAHGQSGRDSGERRWNEMKAQLTKLNMNCRNVSNNFLPHFALNSPNYTPLDVFTNGNSLLFSLRSRQSFSPFVLCCNSCTDKIIPNEGFFWCKCIICKMLIAIICTFVAKHCQCCQ